MKKKFLLYILFLLIVSLVGGGIYMTFFKKDKTFESSNNFKLKDYNYYVENFSSEKVLGEIDSEEQARKTAEKVFVEIYGKSVVDKKPYRVSFDDESQVWLVQGNISKHNIGGIPNILIQKSDGKVLAIWHSK